MVKITIDGRQVEVKEGMTILQAAESIGIEIPHLCFHPAFPPEGSCRLCLVEIEGRPKLELACSTIVQEGMTISTQSETVRQARRSVLEFLLAEHPLDCPICDKAGNCQLQDYYQEYGLFDSQFKENKERKSKKVALGKNLILDRERCILCTRCVRFLKEITRTGELGVFQRGLRSEIDYFPGQPVDNNYSGNLAELCPVGAITDKDFRFQTRSWFLQSGPSICPHCSRACSIYIDYHVGFPRVELDKYVYRIRARENPEINDYWICDFGRYNYAYLEKKRATKVLVRENGQAQEGDWDSQIERLVKKIKEFYLKKKSNRIGLVLHSALTNEELYLAKKVFQEDLPEVNIFLIDPPEGEGDNWLLTPSRTPNLKGLELIGLQPQKFPPEKPLTELEILIIFAYLPHGEEQYNQLRPLLEKSHFSVLFTAHQTALMNQVDVVFPTTLLAEKEGSVVNVEEKLQKFPAALTPPGTTRSEREILLTLGRGLGINFPFYRQLKTPAAVFDQLSQDISYFRGSK